MDAAPGRILVVRTRFVGDTVLAIPFLRNLRRAFPAARIDVLVEKASGSVLADCPYVDELITAPGITGKGRMSTCRAVVANAGTNRASRTAVTHGASATCPGSAMTTLARTASRRKVAGQRAGGQVGHHW